MTHTSVTTKYVSQAIDPQDRQALSNAFAYMDELGFERSIIGGWNGQNEQET